MRNQRTPGGDLQEFGGAWQPFTQWIFKFQFVGVHRGLFSVTGIRAPR